MNGSYTTHRVTGPLARVGFLLLTAAGAILMVFGASVSASSIGQSFAELFDSGVPDRAIFLLLGGGLVFLGGIIGLVLGTRSFLRER